MSTPRDNETIREMSGEVSDIRPLVAFLYLLMRDHVPAGVVERVITEVTDGKEKQFTNGWLARYAQNLASSLEVA